MRRISHLLSVSCCATAILLFTSDIFGIGEALPRGIIQGFDSSVKVVVPPIAPQATPGRLPNPVAGTVHGERIHVTFELRRVGPEVTECIDLRSEGSGLSTPLTACERPVYSGDIIGKEHSQVLLIRLSDERFILKLVNESGEASWIEPLDMYGEDPTSRKHIFYRDLDVFHVGTEADRECVSMSDFPLHDDRRKIVAPAKPVKTSGTGDDQ